MHAELVVFTFCFAKRRVFRLRIAAEFFVMWCGFAKG
jgi:hypothetical protein